MHVTRGFRTFSLRTAIVVAVSLLPCSFSLGEDTPVDRIQLVTDWMNAVITNKTVGNIQHLDPDERAELIEEIRDWMSGIPSSAEESSPAAVAEAGPSVSASDVFPDRWTLFLRVPQAKIDWAQAPPYVYGVPVGAAKTVNAAFYPNPDSALFTGSATFDFSQAFLTLADRAKLCRVVSAPDVTQPEKVNGVEKDTAGKTKKDYGCSWQALMGLRSVDLAQRVVSSFNVTSTISQNPKFTQGLIPQPGTVLDKTTYSGSVTGTFDPKHIFRTATDLNSIFGIFSPEKGSDTKVNFGLGSDVEKLQGRIYQALGCGENFPPLKGENPKQDLRHCIRHLSYGGGQQWAEILLPVVQVKAVTPSDLYKTGTNTFVQPPTQFNALYEVSATWSLTNWVPNAALRADAVSTLQSGQRLLSHTPAKQQASTVSTGDQRWKAQVAWLCLQLVSRPEIAENDAWWAKFQDAVLVRQ
jgi:hypothetical protein